MTADNYIDVMKPCLRDVLAGSHVAAVAIAILVFWFISSIFESAWPWIVRAGQFLFMAVAILDTPYFSTMFDVYDPSTLIVSGFYVYSAIVSLSAAWLLARWVYDKGPLQVLASYHHKLQGTRNA